MSQRWYGLAAIACLLTTLAACGAGSVTTGIGGSKNTAATVYVSLASLNAVAVYRVDSSNKFTSVLGSPFAVGTSPTSVLVHPSNKFIYVVNEGSDSISLLTPDSRTGVLTEVLPRTSTDVGPVAMIMNKAGSMIFVLNQASSTISVYSVNSSNGALTAVAGSPFSTAPHPSAIALCRSENFIFVANVNLNSVSTFSIDSGGALHAVGSPFPVGGTGPTALAAGISDHFLYVANELSGNISIMTINSTTGALSEILGSPFTETGTSGVSTTSTGPNSIDIDPTGSFLYITNGQSNNVFAFNVDSTTGKLNPLSGSPVGTGTNPTFSLISPAGTTLFVGNPGSANITYFSINMDGTLTSNSNTLATTVAPSSMAFTH